MKIGKYEFDVAYDYPLIDILKSFSGKITLLQYEKNGPGGGNQRLVVEAGPADWDFWCMENYSEDPSAFLISIREI